MPAPEKSREKSSLKKTIPTLGIIAGGGIVPQLLLHACDKAGQDVFVIAFEGQTDPEILKNRPSMLTRIGAAGQIIRTLRSRDIKDLVFIGSVRRPGLVGLKPDLRTAQFFTRVGLRAMGDDTLLKAVRHELEKEGFTIHGVQEFVDDLVAVAGQVGRLAPKKQDWPDIERGLAVAQTLGQLDVGQSVIIQDGIVLGVEAAEGTDELIKRCRLYQRHGSRGALLVKTCKPQQDRDFDLPSIGVETVRMCAENGVSGIVIQAGRSLLINPQDVASLADHHKIFVIALDPESRGHDQ
ncbi:MAG: DUF1009 domain-containing protein [Alphaproteobacteria bacterium CG_4_9_14_3_um_filter_47_13]|nr:MAG: DUF1009 domain-containing protein [Alphaproteobacteria bacterium CG_4_9_14_3_um_filter_47_13]